MLVNGLVPNIQLIGSRDSLSKKLGVAFVVEKDNFLYIAVRGYYSPPISVTKMHIRWQCLEKVCAQTRIVFPITINTRPKENIMNFYTVWCSLRIKNNIAISVMREIERIYSHA